jgi:hypothetical protein
LYKKMKKQPTTNAKPLQIKMEVIRGSINPKVEIRNPKETRSSKSEGQIVSQVRVGFRASVFGFLSGFGLRASGFDLAVSPSPANARRAR